MNSAAAMDKTVQYRRPARPGFAGVPELKPLSSGMSSPHESTDERRLEADQLLGARLVGKWRLQRVLGMGATSTVFEAVHNNGHRVAIKVLRRDLSFNSRVRERFLREGYLANRVGHPGVVAVIDDGTTDDGLVFLVIELLSGESLAARLTNAGGVLHPVSVLQVARAVLDVLSAAHARGIIHRDIKPANVFVTGAGTTKVLDFGLARLCDVASDVFQSGSGGLVGTPAYMAPEQARGLPGSATAQTDLWGVGATLFRALSGRTVHSAATVNQMIIATATEAAPPLRAIAPHVPDSVAAIVDRALKLHPADRWPSATEMNAAITRVLASGELARVASSVAPAVLPQSSSTSDDGSTLPGNGGSTGQLAAGAVSFTAPPRERRTVRSAVALGAFALAAAGVTPLVLRHVAPPSRVPRLDHLQLPELEARAAASPALSNSELPSPVRPPSRPSPPMNAKLTKRAPAPQKHVSELPDSILDRRK
jgi:serine/threonine-protein kinase